MSPQRDVLNELAEVRPARLDPGPGYRRRDPQAIMAHPRLTTGTARAARRPTRRLVLAGVVPTAAVVAAGAVFLTIGTTGAGTGPGGALGVSRPTADPSTVTAGPTPRTARELLLVAAERNASTSATSGRYWVRQKEDGAPSKVGPKSRPYYVVSRAVWTQWDALHPGDQDVIATQELGAVPMTAKDKAAWEADGSPSRWTLPGSAPDYTPVVITSKPGEEQVRIATPPQPRDAKAPAAVERRYELAGHPTTLAELNKLPTEPTALKQWLVKQLEKNEIYIANDHTLFQAGLDLVFRLPVTPQVRAAAYRMLADVKGVTSLGPVTDQRGRAGMAVASARKDDGGNWIQIRLIIDPQTGQALAEESWDLGNGKSPASAGELRRYTLLLSSGFSDDTPPAETGPRGR